MKPNRDTLQTEAIDELIETFLRLSPVERERLGLLAEFLTIAPREATETAEAYIMSVTRSGLDGADELACEIDRVLEYLFRSISAAKEGAPFAQDVSPLVQADVPRRFRRIEQALSKSSD